MQRERMAIARPAIFTVVVIVAIGSVLAGIAPPHWQACELVLLTACAALIWECFRVEDRPREARCVQGSPRFSRAAWFGGSSADLHELRRAEFRPWDVEQAVSRLRPAGLRIHDNPSQHARSDHQSVEQITHEMLLQAFRQASLKHHGDDFSDAENTRRVYAARELILRAIQKD
jgi:hypothetical protein